MVPKENYRRLRNRLDLLENQGKILFRKYRMYVPSKLSNRHEYKEAIFYTNVPNLYEIVSFNCPEEETKAENFPGFIKWLL